MSRATIRYSPRHVPAQLFTACFPLPSRTEFYREEILKHQRCLDQQREYFSEQAIHNVETALQTILARLDTLCRHHDCDRVLSGVLKKLDMVTRLSKWDDPGHSH